MRSRNAPNFMTSLGLIAIKFKCYQTYYACYLCHEAEAGHPAQVWKSQEFDKKAILCGACGEELTIDRYLQCDAVCPACPSGFNPGCRHHHHLYFET